MDSPDDVSSPRSFCSFSSNEESSAEDPQMEHTRNLGPTDWDQALLDEQLHGITDDDNQVYSNLGDSMEGDESHPSSVATSESVSDLGADLTDEQDSSTATSSDTSHLTEPLGGEGESQDNLDPRYILGRRRTVKFFRDNLDAPVWPGHTLTVKQVITLITSNELTTMQNIVVARSSYADMRIILSQHPHGVTWCVLWAGRIH
jgi:hypothetical protein